MHTAIVLIAHGSRRDEANAELRTLAETIGARLPHDRVVPAFLELAEPTIPDAVESCIAAGAQRVRLFPYFLSAGMHVTRDLEDFRQQFAARHPEVEFLLARPLGAHPDMSRIVLELLTEPANAGATCDADSRRVNPTQSE